MKASEVCLSDCTTAVNSFHVIPQTLNVPQRLPLSPLLHHPDAKPLVSRGLNEFV